MKENKSISWAAALSMLSCSAMPAYAEGEVPPTFHFLELGRKGRVIGQDDAHLQLILKTDPGMLISVDQPNHDVTRMSTQRFFSLWPSFFGDKPLNALLTVKVAGEAEPVPMVMLIKNPVYDEKTKEVTYEAERLDLNPHIDEGSVGLITDKTSTTPHDFSDYGMSFDSVQAIEWPDEVKWHEYDKYSRPTRGKQDAPTTISYDLATTKSS